MIITFEGSQDDLRRMSFHESGHLVVGRFLGDSAITGATIFPSAHYAGSVYTEAGQDISPKEALDSLMKICAKIMRNLPRPGEDRLNLDLDP